MITLDVSSMFAATAGGIRTYYEAKARHLPAAGNECHFVLPGRYRRTEQLGASLLHRIPGPPIGAGYRAFGDIPAQRDVVRAIKPDVIEVATHYALPQLLPTTNARVVGFYHADVATTYVEPALARVPALQRVASALTWKWMRRQHERYSMTLAGSHHVVERLTARRIPRVRWVGLGVDADAFRPAARCTTRRIGYAGRLSNDKEIGVLLEAVETLQTLSVVIAGSGPRAREIEQLAVPGVLHYEGVVPRSAMPAFLRGIDVLIVPGRYESFSLVTAEALACGTPVIAPDVGGAGELIERSGGGLQFRAGDSSSLATAIGDFYDLTDAERTAMGMRGRDYVLAELTWERVFARMSALYEEARCSS